MPGVPSGRGCDACRAQKKKCDQAKPSCSRCTRLKLACVGAGQQRYKFKEERGFREPSSKSQLVTSKPRPQQPNTTKTVPFAPSNDMTVLVSAFVEKISSKTDLRYNLAWTYGGFLAYVPQRIGINEALDQSVLALVKSHSDYCASKEVSLRALEQYATALSKLREYVGNPAKAQAIETLCAVMVLMICQAFIGVMENRWTGHCEGAAQIIKARRYYDPKDEFESILLLTLRGPVLFEGLLNNKIQFSAEEWRTLVQNHMDDHQQSEGNMMQCLSHVPDYMRRGRRILRGDSDDPSLVYEMRATYETSKAVVAQLQGEMMGAQNCMANERSPSARSVKIFAYYQRLYALAMTISIILNCVLGAIDIENLELGAEATYFAREILTISYEAVLYRPLGASFVSLALWAAWTGTDDEVLKSLIVAQLIEYERDFPRRQDPMLQLDRLESASRQLHLLDLDQSND